MRVCRKFDLTTPMGLEHAVNICIQGITAIGKSTNAELAGILANRITASMLREGLSSYSFGGLSVEAKAVCLVSGATRKSVATFSLKKVWSYANNEEEVLGKRTRVSTCRSHSPTCQLFCCLSRTVKSSSFGFPLLVMAMEEGDWHVLFLELPASTWEYSQCVKRCALTLTLKKVKLSRLRDYHEAIYQDGFLYVHLAGHRTFNHI